MVTQDAIAYVTRFVSVLVLTRPLLGLILILFTVAMGFGALFASLEHPRKRPFVLQLFPGYLLERFGHLGALGSYGGSCWCWILLVNLDAIAYVNCFSIVLVLLRPLLGHVLILFNVAMGFGIWNTLCKPGASRSVPF